MTLAFADSTCTRQVRYNAPMTESRTIAIGDIHGCSAALATLIQAIDPTLSTPCFLGDYIDEARQPGVLEQSSLF